MQPVQIKMARAALGLSVDDLARQAGVSPQDLGALESGSGFDPATTQGLGLFFAAHGIELIDADGVRAKPPESKESITVDKLTTDNDGGEG